MLVWIFLFYMLWVKAEEHERGYRISMLKNMKQNYVTTQV